METREAAIAAIRMCKTRETLDQMLTRFDITQPKDIIDHLQESMYSPDTYFSSKPITIEEELEFTKQIFLTGTWQLNSYYDKMGISREPAHA